MLFVKYPGFRWLWSGQLLSQLGNAVFYILGLWEIQLKSPFLLSVAGLVMTLPAMLGMFGGVLVDRVDARKLMLLTDVLRGTAVLLGIVALAVPHALVWVVIVLLGINSLGVAFFGPAESVILPHMVESADLPGANGLYALTNQLSSAVGAALGGAAVAAIGIKLVFGFDMASFWLSALAIWLMMRTVARPAAAPSSDTGEHVGFKASFREGLGAFRSIPVMVRLLPLIVLMNFSFVAAFTMLPYWVHHRLHASALAYGLVDAAWAAGVVLGSIASGRLGKWPLKSALGWAFGVQSVLMLLFGVSHLVWVSSLLLLIAGITNGIGNAMAFTWFQRIIPVAVRGRVFGLIMTLFSLANPLGALAAGLTLHVLPPASAWFLGGASGLVFVAGILRNPDAFEEGASQALTVGGD